ncbi:MAG: GGDEF domain-containing protein [Lachnospiraceae bacterium]|nr:GGDEF domain-containing protein [Lachnospiraceae bacterium]
MPEKKRPTIGVLIGNANSMHSVNTLQGIRQAAKEAGVNTVTFLGVHTEYKFKDFYDEDISYDYQIMTIFDYVDIAHVDALIISYGEIVVFLQEAKRRHFLDKYVNIPKILLEERVENDITRYQISDNYNGMRSVVEHLVRDHGYRHFVCLRGPIGNKDADERYRAFADVLAEYHIPVTDEMVQVGDFTEAVEPQVEYLFDHNPKVQAFVCANDTMATTVYKVCKERRAEIFRMTERAREWMKNSTLRYKVGIDIESGEGIAVTGYDDAAIASIMDPSLTTVAQNQFAIGYKALYNLLDLIKAKESKDAGNIVLQTELIRRSSCGCQDTDQGDFEPMSPHDKQNPEFYVIKLAEHVKNAIIVSDVSEGIADKIYETIYDILYADIIIYLGYVKETLSIKHVVEQLRNLMNGPYAEYISPTALTKTYSDYLSSVIRKTEDHNEEVLLTEIMLEGVKYLQGFAYKNVTDTLYEFENDAWFMSMMARDMVNHVDSEKEMFRNAIRRFKNLKMGETYVYTTKEPMIVEADEEWKSPDTLYLSAYTSADGSHFEAYHRADRPELTREHSFADFSIERGCEQFHFTLLPIFSDRVQYGILASEVYPQDVKSLFNVSVQLGTALKYNELSRKQREVQNALESLVKEVEDKNSMLRFISEYDALTDCLNRRGFIERAVNLKNDNPGLSCVAIFADLDHLKEINDRFGHAEGDFAIKTVAGFIRHTVGANQILGRLGGDEFVAIAILKDGETPEQICDAIKRTADDFNAASDKPFYIECSIGYNAFTCKETLDIQEVLDAADRELYKSKKNRRETSVRS